MSDRLEGKTRIPMGAVGPHFREDAPTGKDIMHDFCWSFANREETIQRIDRIISALESARAEMARLDIDRDICETMLKAIYDLIVKRKGSERQDAALEDGA